MLKACGFGEMCVYVCLCKVPSDVLEVCVCARVRACACACARVCV